MDYWCTFAWNQLFDDLKAISLDYKTGKITREQKSVANRVAWDKFLNTNVPDDNPKIEKKLRKLRKNGVNVGWTIKKQIVHVWLSDFLLYGTVIFIFVGIPMMLANF